MTIQINLEANYQIVTPLRQPRNNFETVNTTSPGSGSSGFKSLAGGEKGSGELELPCGVPDDPDPFFFFPPPLLFLAEDVLGGSGKGTLPQIPFFIASSSQHSSNIFRIILRINFQEETK